MPKVLIASLGESPGVVTGTIDALRREEEPVYIDKVVALHTTKKRIVTRCVDGILRPEIENYYNEPIEFENHELKYEKDGRTISVTEILTKEDSGAFFDLVCEQISKHREKGYEIYLDIAGGRKTMSSLMVVAGEILGIEEIFHILVEDEIQEEGHIDNLWDLKESGDEERLEELLHPMGTLVRLPFIRMEKDQPATVNSGDSEFEEVLDKLGTEMPRLS